jgi:hypothetical protein
MIFLLRELVPIGTTLILTGGNIGKLLFNYWIFYSVYEIGTLWNDTHFGNEKNPTKRIVDGVKINFWFFVMIRLLPMIYYPRLLICLPIFFIHTSINKKYRVITITLLRFLRTFLPIYYLLNNQVILKVGLIIFVFYQIPSIIYYYYYSKKMIGNKYPILIELLIFMAFLPIVLILNKELLPLVFYLLVVRIIELFFTTS